MPHPNLCSVKMAVSEPANRVLRVRKGGRMEHPLHASPMGRPSRRSVPGVLHNARHCILGAARQERRRHCKHLLSSRSTRSADDAPTQIIPSDPVFPTEIPEDGKPTHTLPMQTPGDATPVMPAQTPLPLDGTPLTAMEYRSFFEVSWFCLLLALHCIF